VREIDCRPDERARQGTVGGVLLAAADVAALRSRPPRLHRDPCRRKLSAAAELGLEVNQVSRLPHLSLPTVLLCAAAVIIGYLAINTARYVVHNYELRQQETQARAGIAQLDQDHAQLVAVRDYLQSDAYVERVARRVLGLVHPGETLVVVSPSGAAAADAATPQDDGAGEPWWKRLFVPPTPAPAH
jgi:cell division protein FtsB